MASVRQESVLSPLLLATVVIIITENARRDVINEKLLVDDLILIRETAEDLDLKLKGSPRK